MQNKAWKIKSINISNFVCKTKKIRAWLKPGFDEGMSWGGVGGLMGGGKDTYVIP